MSNWLDCPDCASFQGEAERLRTQLAVTKAERDEARRDAQRITDVLLANHGGEPLTLMDELDDLRAQLAALRERAEHARQLHESEMADVRGERDALASDNAALREIALDVEASVLDDHGCHLDMTTLRSCSFCLTISGRIRYAFRSHLAPVATATDSIADPSFPASGGDSRIAEPPVSAQVYGGNTKSRLASGLNFADGAAPEESAQTPGKPRPGPLTPAAKAEERVNVERRKGERRNKYDTSHHVHIFSTVIYARGDSCALHANTRKGGERRKP